MPEDAEEFAEYALIVDGVRAAAAAAAASSGVGVGGGGGAVAGGEAPLLVHCSGGVGRSGAFIASHCAWRVMAAAASNDVESMQACSLLPYATVLRQQRHPWAIESEAQYCFAYSVLAELLDSKHPVATKASVQ